MIYVRRVFGESMLPTYRRGQIVVALRRRRYRKGDIVIAKAMEREIIKRVVRIVDDMVHLEGDNALASSQHEVPVFDIVARVYWPRRR